MNKTIVQFLLSKVDNKTINETFLHAAKINDVNTMCECLEHGADIEYRKENDKQNALFIAMQERNAEAVFFLLDNGAFPLSKHQAETPMQYMQKYPNLFAEIIKIFDDFLALPAKKRLAIACAGGNVLHAQHILLHENVDLNTRIDFPINNAHFPGSSYLSIACFAQNKKLVELLLNHGAMIELPGDEDSALYSASCMDDVEIVKLLISRRANVNYKSIYCYKKSSVLHIAVDKAKTKNIEELLKAGADMHVTDSLGNPSYFCALKHREMWKVFPPFMNYGLDPNIVIKGKTLFMHACELELVNFVDYLLKHGANPNISIDGKTWKDFAHGKIIKRRELLKCIQKSIEKKNVNEL